MWIFVAGMVRSATTMQYHMAQEVIKRAKVPHAFYRKWDETRAADGLSDDTYRLFKRHLYAPEIAVLHPKVIYSYRDFRDVVASWMHFKNISFEELLRTDMMPNTLQAYADWTAQAQLMVTRYEDICDLEALARRMAEFLEVELSPKHIRQIAVICDRDAQIRLHDVDRRHIFTGETGQWRTALTREQAAFVEGFAYKWMIDHGYTGGIIV